MQLTNTIQISSNLLKYIINSTQQIVKDKQILKILLPEKCQKQISTILTEPFTTVFGVNNQQSNIPSEKINQNHIKFDNRSLLKMKIEKNQNSNQQNERLKNEITINRKFSSSKSNRAQVTTGMTSRKNKQSIQLPLSSQMKKRTHTAEISSRLQKNFFELINNVNSFEKDMKKQQNQKRYELIEKINKVQKQKQASDMLQQKLVNYRRSLQMQLQAVKQSNQKQSSIKRSKQPVQIVSFQSNNGSLLTNQGQKQHKKTIENIVFLKFEQGQKDTIIKRNKNKQTSPCKRKQISNKLEDEEEGVVQKFNTINLNYNNSGRRQLSLIPYVTISPGIKIQEKALNATISRNNPPGNLSRQKFIESSRGKSFRSYSFKKPDVRSVESKFMTIDISAKTHRVTKSTFHHQNNDTKDSFGESILWKPKTCRLTSNRIKLINEEYIKELTSG